MQKGSLIAILFYAADTQVGYTRFACYTLQQQWVQGDYQERKTSDKQMGCSCKKL
jgi:hypothetical protein